MIYKILVIEDEPQIQEVVGKYLENAGYEVTLKENGIDGLAAFTDCQPHLIVLDVMMPGISGFDVLQSIRQISQVPVIMLTAKHKEDDRIKGFNLGTDDYIPKPFSPKELVKRVEAVLRRSYTPQNSKPLLVCNELILDIGKQKLYKNREEVSITSNEFRLLKVLFQNQGVLLTRQQLIENSFGYDYEGFDRNIDTYIKNIRQKIENDSRKPIYLKTKYGAGYIFSGR